MGWWEGSEGWEDGESVEWWEVCSVVWGGRVVCGFGRWLSLCGRPGGSRCIR